MLDMDANVDSQWEQNPFPVFQSSVASTFSFCYKKDRYVLCHAWLQRYAKHPSEIANLFVGLDLEWYISFLKDHKYVVYYPDKFHVHALPPMWVLELRQNQSTLLKYTILYRVFIADTDLVGGMHQIVMSLTFKCMSSIRRRVIKPNQKYWGAPWS